MVNIPPMLFCIMMIVVVTNLVARYVPVVLAQTPVWTQRGGDIDGEAEGDNSGLSVSLSGNGNVVAIGAPMNDGNGTDSGHVRVYEWDMDDSGGWTQRGDDIDGEAAYSNSGSVSLSADGSVVAIGAPDSNGKNGYYSGHVRVYEWDVAGSGGWTQRGDDIDGEAADDYSGVSVSLSADGTVVAIGAPTDYWNDSQRSGYVRVYQWDVNGREWTQRGNDIDGEATVDTFGISVSLSADGNVVAIGAPTDDWISPQRSGYVRVYEWDVVGRVWTQLGGDIDGEAAGDGSGWSVSLSDDGSVVAIGAPWNGGNGYYSGHVGVYEWDVVGRGWTQRGDDIDGEAVGDMSGYSVSLSADGSVVAIGAYGNDENGERSGHVRVYEWDVAGSGWTQLGDDIDGEAKDDQSGRSVSLSADGSLVAVGASGIGYYSGHVRIYKVQASQPNTSQTPSVKPSTSQTIPSFQPSTSQTPSFQPSTGQIPSVKPSTSQTIPSFQPSTSQTPSFQPSTGQTPSSMPSPRQIPSFKPSKILIPSGELPTISAVPSLSLQPVAFAQTLVWTQLGDDIDGEAAGDYSGVSVSLSADGSVVAIGAENNDGNGYHSGHVRVYEWDVVRTKWNQLGGDIDGEAARDYSGASVSLSADGSVVAIGASSNSGSGIGSGHVQVYEWDAVRRGWTQRGGDIDGEAAYDWSGVSVSLSADGNVVAIGADGNDGNGIDSGHVRVYEWDVNGREWTQRGDDIDGEATYDWSGWSVSLSADGSVVAIGAPTDYWNGPQRSGYVRVYQWDMAGRGWTQRGDDIDGEAAGDGSGWSVSLSADCSVVAIGASSNARNGQRSGHVRVYEWDVVGRGWTQLGGDIDGEAVDDMSGYSVSLSADGRVVAIGAPHNDGNGIDSGHVRVYEWDVAGRGWTQRGDDIDGEAKDDQSGRSVSLSADGSVVAIGAYRNDGNGYYSGHVRVYKVQAYQPNTSQTPSVKPSTSQTIPSFQPSTSQTPSFQPSTSQTPSSQPSTSPNSLTHFLYLNILITSFMVICLAYST